METRWLTITPWIGGPLDESDIHEARRQARRFRTTPADRLEAAAQAVYEDLCGRLSRSRGFRAHDDTSPELTFKVPFLEIVPDDVVAEVRKKFTAMGFQTLHHVDDSRHGCDFLEITAPANWVEMLLKVCIQSRQKN